MKGVEKAVEEKPLPIIMNIMMPGIDGPQATHMIRSNSETKLSPS